MKLSMQIMRRLLPGVMRERCEYRKSYSQCGEDMIVDFAFAAMRIATPTYLDIGAHHPTHFSNTYFFYSKGCRGVTVEPDPMLFTELQGVRPGDTHLNVGVGKAAMPTLPFYVMSTRTLSSFSKSEAERYQGTSLHKIEAVIDVPVLTVGEIFELHFPRQAPDFVSVDVEGLDFEIIQSIDFAKNRPVAICVETLTFSEDRSETKLREIIDYVCERDYIHYADTYINSIFIDRARWKAR